jgi:Uma2 family endonuclease
MSAATQLPTAMTVDEFLAWEPPDGSDRWELVDGAPRAMAPAAPPHGFIQAETARLIGNHLAERHPDCRVATEPGVQPKVRGKSNVRVPDLAVTCTRQEPGDRLLREPVVVIEILSPSNKAETWQNVWSYVTIPSVREVLVVCSAEVRIDLLRRESSGAWPDDPLPLRSGDNVKAGLTGYDANYLRLARHLRADLVTLDRQLERAAAGP